MQILTIVHTQSRCLHYSWRFDLVILCSCKLPLVLQPAETQYNIKGQNNLKLCDYALCEIINKNWNQAERWWKNRNIIKELDGSGNWNRQTWQAVIVLHPHSASPFILSWISKTPPPLLLCKYKLPLGTLPMTFLFWKFNLVLPCKNLLQESWALYFQLLYNKHQPFPQIQLNAPCKLHFELEL